MANKVSVKNQVSKLKRSTAFDIPFTNIVYFSMALNIINLLFVFLVQKRLPPEIPLFYGLAKGNEQIALSIQLMYPPSFSLSILIVNIIISSFIKNLQKTLILTSLFIATLAVIATLKIFLLVGRI